MKFKKLLPLLVIGFMFVGCGNTDIEEVEDSTAQETQLADTEEAPEVEAAVTEEETSTESDDQAEASTDSEKKELTDDQANAAVWNYLCSENPEYADYDGDAPCYTAVTSEEGADEIIVDFRSYTGAHEYFYIDRATGDTHSTEFVPGIIDEEEDTGLRINLWDYVN